MGTLDWLYGVVYIVELCLKVVALGREYFFSGWNLIDLSVVLVWLMETLVWQANERIQVFPVNSMVFRMFRLTKLLRLLTLIRSISQLRQLLLLTTALKGCFHMLMWSSLLLFICLSAPALILNQALTFGVIENGDISMEARHWYFAYFGTYSRAMLSVFELALGNWVPISRYMTEN